MKEEKKKGRFVFVVAKYYDDVIARDMLESGKEELARHNDSMRKSEEEAASDGRSISGMPQIYGVLESEVIEVPGALELPLALKYAAEDIGGNIVAMAAFGCVVRGETYHFEIVADTCARGILQVQLQTGMPIGNGVLTVDTMEQAQNRHDKKARDAVKAAIELAQIRATHTCVLCGSSKRRCC